MTRKIKRNLKSLREMIKGPSRRTCALCHSDFGQLLFPCRRCGRESCFSHMKWHDECYVCSSSHQANRYYDVDDDDEDWAWMCG